MHDSVLNTLRMVLLPITHTEPTGFQGLQAAPVLSRNHVCMATYTPTLNSH